MQTDLDEMNSELRAAEDRAKKAMADAARLADELRQEQEHSLQVSALCLSLLPRCFWRGSRMVLMGLGVGVAHTNEVWLVCSWILTFCQLYGGVVSLFLGFNVPSIA